MSLSLFTDTSPTHIYTLSLHDALPISYPMGSRTSAVNSIESVCAAVDLACVWYWKQVLCLQRDRKSTRLNSSHSQISYAVFCLKKKTRAQVSEQATCNCRFAFTLRP